MDCVKFLKSITAYKELVKKEEKPVKKATEEEKQEALKLKDEANAVFGKGNYEKALEIYTKAADLDPENGVIFSNISACYFNLREFEKALENAQLSKGLKPDWPKAHFREAEAFF